MARKPPGLFITGTDTGVGKTYVAALIARALREQGHAVGVYKPVATGCREVRRRVISDDAEALWQAAGKPGDLDRVCPQMFLAPLAPHLAAAEEGRCVDAKLLRAGVRYWQDRSDIVLVEGAGGLMSPVTDDEYNADLAYDLRYPLLVVAPNRIGAINQTIQTLITAATFREGLSIAGIVLNQPSADMVHEPSAATNRVELERRCTPPVLDLVGYGAHRLASDLDWTPIAKVPKL